jgi:hypothetical protein
LYLLGFCGPAQHGKSTSSASLRELARADGLKLYDHGDVEFSDVFIEVMNEWAEKLHQCLDQPDDSSDTAILRWLLRLPDVVEQVTGKWIARSELTSLHFSDKEGNELLRRYIEDAGQRAKVQITRINKGEHRLPMEWLGSRLRWLRPTIWVDTITRQVGELIEAGNQFITVGGIRYLNDIAVLSKFDGKLVKVENPRKSQPAHPTEAELHRLEPHVLIVNDADLAALQRTLAHFWGDLTNGDPRAIYQSSVFSASLP